MPKPRYRTLWMFPRNIRKIEPWKLVQIAGLIEGCAENIVDQDVQDEIYDRLAGLGVKVSRQDDGVANGGGLRTYLAQLACLGFFWKDLQDDSYRTTRAGELLLEAKEPGLLLRRQLLRMQFPSVYGLGHNVAISPVLKVRPFVFLLELMSDKRLLGLTTTEMAVPVIYGRTFDDFELCVKKILKMRLMPHLRPQVRLRQVVDSVDDLRTPKRFHEQDPELDWERGLEDVESIANTAKNYLESALLIRVSDGDDSLFVVNDDVAEEVSAWMDHRVAPVDPDRQEDWQLCFGRADHEKGVRPQRSMTVPGFATLIRNIYLSEYARTPDEVDVCAFVREQALKWDRAEEEIECAIKPLLENTQSSMRLEENSGGKEAGTVDRAMMAIEFDESALNSPTSSTEKMRHRTQEPLASSKGEVFAEEQLESHPSPEEIAELLTQDDIAELIGAFLNGLSVNAVDADGNSLMLRAIQHKAWKVVHYLLQVGADPSLQNSAGWCAIDEAFAKGAKDWAERLQKALIKIGGTYTPSPRLPRSRYDGHLLFDLPAPVYDVAAEAFRWVRRGDVERITNLAQFGLNPDAVNERGDTLLTVAIRSGNVDVVRCLLDLGADPGLMDVWGKTPLELAHEDDRRDVIRLLEERLFGEETTNVTFAEDETDNSKEVQTDVEDTTKPAHVGWDSFDWDGFVSESREPTGPQASLDADSEPAAGGADVEVPLRNDQACAESAESRQTAEPGDSPVSDEMFSAAFRCVKSRRYDQLKGLVRAGLDLNMRNGSGQTLLTAAILTGDKNSVVALAALGADVEKKTGDGLTPVEVAEGMGRLDMVRILQQRIDQAEEKRRTREAEATQEAFALQTQLEPQSEPHEESKEQQQEATPEKLDAQEREALILKLAEAAREGNFEVLFSLFKADMKSYPDEDWGHIASEVRRSASVPSIRIFLKRLIGKYKTSADPAELTVTLYGDIANNNGVALKDHLSFGANPNGSAGAESLPIVKALAVGNSNIIQQLIKWGATLEGVKTDNWIVLEAREDRRRRALKGDLPEEMLLAAALGNVELVEEYFCLGVHPWAHSSMGRPLSYFAEFSGSEALCALLRNPTASSNRLTPEMGESAPEAQLADVEKTLSVAPLSVEAPRNGGEIAADAALDGESNLAAEADEIFRDDDEEGFDAFVAGLRSSDDGTFAGWGDCFSSDTGYAYDEKRPEAKDQTETPEESVKLGEGREKFVGAHADDVVVRKEDWLINAVRLDRRKKCFERLAEFPASQTAVKAFIDLQEGREVKPALLAVYRELFRALKLYCDDYTRKLARLEKE